MDDGRVVPRITVLGRLDETRGHLSNASTHIPATSSKRGEERKRWVGCICTVLVRQAGSEHVVSCLGAVTLEGLYRNDGCSCTDC